LQKDNEDLLDKVHTGPGEFTMSISIVTATQAPGWMDGCISRTRESVQTNRAFASSVGHSLNTTGQHLWRSTLLEFADKKGYKGDIIKSRRN